jgi:hypothetical protein
MSAPVLSVALELLFEEFFSIARYPLWWYGTGFQGLLNWVHEGLRYRWRSYAISLWARHLTTPMYGEYSLLGRAVSLFMRIVVIAGRSVAWVVEALVYLLLIVVWVVWPLAAVFGLLYALLNQQLLPLV